MKNIFTALLSSLFLLSASAAYCEATVELKAGFYDLKGNTDGSDQMRYKGRVTITPHGKNYLIIGKRNGVFIGGIGILEQNILSVAFCSCDDDLTGVASYTVNPDGTLVGKWVQVDSTKKHSIDLAKKQGVEQLTYTWITPYPKPIPKDIYLPQSCPVRK